MSRSHEVVFALDVEMVTGNLTGRRENLAGRVVLVCNDPVRDRVRVVLDTYVKHEEGVVINCLTKWSKIEPWMLDGGIDLFTLREFLMNLVAGHTLITF